MSHDLNWPILNRADESARTVALGAGGSSGSGEGSIAPVFEASWHAEHVRAFRRGLCQRLAIIAASWMVLTVALALGLVVLAIGLGVLAAAALCALSIEWRAGRRLAELIERERLMSAPSRAPHGCTS